MICTLTARRIKAGEADDFMTAFEGSVNDTPDEISKRWSRVYICRDVEDENVVLSFGFFDGTLEELRGIQSQHDRAGQLATLAPYVEEELLDASYEVVEEFTP